MFHVFVVFIYLWLCVFAVFWTPCLLRGGWLSTKEFKQGVLNNVKTALFLWDRVQTDSLESDSRKGLEPNSLYISLSLLLSITHTFSFTNTSMFDTHTHKEDNTKIHTANNKKCKAIRKTII